MAGKGSEVRCVSSHQTETVAAAAAAASTARIAVVREKIVAQQLAVMSRQGLLCVALVAGCVMPPDEVGV